MWGSLISAGASLLGGALEQSGAGSRASQQIDLARDNMQMQREFAQQGVRWRVEDAKAAGIHPLFALGFQGQLPSPVSVFPEGPSYGMGQGIADAGQHIGRAVDSTRTRDERVSVRLGELAVQRGELENQLLASQISRLNQQSGPPMPAMGANLEVTGSSAPIFESKPLEVTIPHVAMPHSEPVAIPDVGWAKTRSGGVVPVPSKDVKERIEDNIIAEGMWALRNQLLPNLPFTPGPRPPNDLLPSGADHWEWSRMKQEWVPMYRRDPRSGEREYRYRLPQ